MIERDKEYYEKKICELYSIIDNQEKIIRDLQNQLKQANEGKEEQKRRKELVQKKRDNYKARLNKLQQKIDRAIEYVEPLLTDREDKFYPICSYNKMVLLEILRGNNEN